MEVYTITDEQMANVNTYVPLIVKQGVAENIASKCFDKLEVSASMGDQTMPMPPMYKENMNRKSRYLMGILVRLYLGGEFEPVEDDDSEMLMSMDEYDKWAGGHILKQIERFKQDTKLRDTCYDMLADYKDFEKRVNCEINSLMNVMNEPVQRIMATLSMSMTPDALQDVMNQAEEIKGQMEEYLTNRDEIMAKKLEEADEEVK